jgi:hypothetical protein
MTCADLEILICDYVEGTLAPADKAEVERHLAECPACAELARDAAAGFAFMERAADVELPPELVTRILFEAPWAKNKSRTGGARRWVQAILSPILQPRFAMGMAMTILSLAMLANFVAPIRHLQPSDLEPAKVWAGFEARTYRTWARTVKFYNNLKFVYQIQTTLHEWQQQNLEQQSAPDRDAPAGNTDERKLPVKPASEPGATAPEAGSGPNRSGGNQ